MMTVLSKQGREKRGETRERERKAKKNKSSERQTTTNRINKSKSPQANKDRHQHTNYIGDTSPPESQGLPRKTTIMTEYDGTQQRKKNRTTPKTVPNNKHDIMIILPHVQNFDRFSNARTHNIKYDKRPPPQLENVQQVVSFDVEISP